MATILPADIDDLHVIGRQTVTRQDLIGREFLTYCLLDLLPRYRVLALLGTSDIGDDASLSEDGWFILDFYLFYYLLALVFPRYKYLILL